MAVIITSILLFLAFAIMNITLKEILFSSVGRDSQFAYYASETGIECALYWDSKYNAFSTSTSGDPLDFKCANSSDINTGVEIPGTTTPARIGGDTNLPSVFGFLMTPGNTSSPCAVVTVRKYYSGSVYKTAIKSYGYNTCDLNNPRRLERGVEVTY